MKKFIALFWMLPLLVHAQHNGPYPFSGGGGGGNTYNYIITNQFSGTVAGFAGTESNMTIVTGGASFPVNGGPTYTESLFTGNVQSNSVYAPAGMILGPTTATFWYSANGGNVFTPTNVYQMVFTNGAEDTALRNTFTTGGIQTNLNTSALVAPSTICVVWSNSPSTFGMAGCTAQWFIGCQVPSTIASVTTTNYSFFSGQYVPVTATTAIVSPTGNNSTGAFGSTNAYANLYAAVRSATVGDTIYVLPGIYNEFTNSCGIAPRDLMIMGLGNPLIAWGITNSTPVLAAATNDFYIEPADNFTLKGVTLSTWTSNSDSAFVGSWTNLSACTNVLIQDITVTYSDSDCFLFTSYSNMQVKIVNCDLSGADDVFTTFAGCNSNSTFVLNGDYLRPNILNGTTYSGRHGANLNSNSRVVFNGVEIDANAVNTGTYNIGVECQNMTAGYVSFNNITFNDGGLNYADVVFPAYVPTNGWFWGTVSSRGTNPVVAVYNTSDPLSSGLVGFPNDFIGNGSILGPLNVPLNISAYSGNPPPQIFGNWLIEDEGKNATLLFTNPNNQVVDSPVSPGWMELEPEGDGTGSPLYGALMLHHLALSLQTNYDALLFAPPESGQMNIAVSNATPFLITANSTNAFALLGGSTGLGTIVNTNWIIGAKYSFPYPIQVSANAILITAGVAGQCDLDLEVAGNTTNRIAIQTIITSVASAYTNYAGAFIPANTPFDFTNRSAGSGDSAAVSGGQYIIY